MRTTTLAIAVCLVLACAVLPAHGWTATPLQPKDLKVTWVYPDVDLKFNPMEHLFQPDKTNDNEAWFPIRATHYAFDVEVPADATIGMVAVARTAGCEIQSWLIRPWDNFTQFIAFNHRSQAYSTLPVRERLPEPHQTGGRFTVVVQFVSNDDLPGNLDEGTKLAVKSVVFFRTTGEIPEVSQCEGGETGWVSAEGDYNSPQTVNCGASVPTTQYGRPAGWCNCTWGLYQADPRYTPNYPYYPLSCDEVCNRMAPGSEPWSHDLCRVPCKPIEGACDPSRPDHCYECAPGFDMAADGHTCTSPRWVSNEAPIAACAGNVNSPGGITGYHHPPGFYLPQPARGILFFSLDHMPMVGMGVDADTGLYIRLAGNPAQPSSGAYYRILLKAGGANAWWCPTGEDSCTNQLAKGQQPPNMPRNKGGRFFLKLNGTALTVGQDTISPGNGYNMFERRDPETGQGTGEMGNTVPLETAHFWEFYTDATEPPAVHVSYCVLLPTQPNPQLPDSDWDRPVRLINAHIAFPSAVSDWIHQLCNSVGGVWSEQELPYAWEYTGVMLPQPRQGDVTFEVSELDVGPEGGFEDVHLVITTQNPVVNHGTATWRPYLSIHWTTNCGGSDGEGGTVPCARVRECEGSMEWDHDPQCVTLNDSYVWPEQTANYFFESTPRRIILNGTHLIFQTEKVTYSGGEIPSEGGGNEGNGENGIPVDIGGGGFSAQLVWVTRAVYQMTTTTEEAPYRFIGSACYSNTHYYRFQEIRTNGSCPAIGPEPFGLGACAETLPGGLCGASTCHSPASTVYAERPVRECLEGVWSMLYCSAAVECPALEAPAHSVGNGEGCGPASIGANCTFACQGGVRSGDAVRVCSGQGTWSGEPLECYQGCEEAPAPEYSPAGTAACPAGPDGSTCHQDCLYGVDDSNVNRECQDGTWSRLVCFAPPCGPLAAPQWGHSACDAPSSSTPADAYCQVGCNHSFGEGEPSSTQFQCAAGVWVGETLVCPAECGAVAPPLYGEPGSDCATLGGDPLRVQDDTCLQPCPNGTISGSSTRVCQADGSWSALVCAAPYCVALGPPRAASGQEAGSGGCAQTPSGGQCTGQLCTYGALTGSEIRNCTNGVWTPLLCDPYAPCAGESAPVYGGGSCAHTRHGGHCTSQTCTRGLKAGAFDRVCNNGTWSPLVCLGFPCLSLAPPAFGAGGCANPTADGQACSVSCAPGPALSGNGTLICANGTWQGTPYTCAPPCAALARPEHGTGTCGVTGSGLSCTAQHCLWGVIDGSETRTCSLGVWSTLTCNPFKPCPAIGAPKYGEGSCPDTPHGAYCNQTCTRGVKSGSTQRWCNDGLWSQLNCSSLVIVVHFNWTQTVFDHYDDVFGHPRRVFPDYVFICPTINVKHGPIWGHPWYTLDSDFCTAAAHATNQRGGMFDVQLRVDLYQPPGPRRGYYAGSTRSSLRSQTWREVYPVTFNVVGVHEGELETFLESSAHFKRPHHYHSSAAAASPPSPAVAVVAETETPHEDPHPEAEPEAVQPQADANGAASTSASASAGVLLETGTEQALWQAQVHKRPEVIPGTLLSPAAPTPTSTSSPSAPNHRLRSARKQRSARASANEHPLDPAPAGTV